MLALWKKSYDKHRQHIKTLLCDKGLSSQSYGFSSNHVWMWELEHKENFAPKNWWFWTVVLEKILENPLDSERKIKPVNPKEINPEYSLEGLMLKLKLQYFGHLMRKADSLEKTLTLGKIETRRRGEGDDTGWDCWMVSPTQWTWVCESSRRWWRTGNPGVLQFMGSQRVGHDWATELTKVIPHKKVKLWKYQENELKRLQRR